MAQVKSTKHSKETWVKTEERAWFTLVAFYVIQPGKKEGPILSIPTPIN